jgi:hypothetical protein
MSVADDVAGEILGIMAGLGLTVGGAAVTVSQRKLPALTEALDSLPAGVLSGSPEPDSDTPFDSGKDGTRGRRLHEYVFEWALIARGNRDYLAGLADYRAAREAASLRLGKPRPLATAGVLWVRLEPGPLLSREAVPAMYDCSGLRLRVGAVVAA